MAASRKTASKPHIPDGWRWVRLGDVASLRKEQVKPAEGDLRPYVALEHIASGGSLNGYGKASDSISNKTIFRRGDTLYGKLRPNLRKVVRADFDGVCSTDILAVCTQEQTDSSFLSYLLSSDFLHLHAMRGVAGTKMPRTSWSHLRRFTLPLPPLAEQRAITAVLDSIDDAIERAEAVIAATEQLRDSLLHALLTHGVPGWHTEWKDAPGVGTIPAAWEVVRLGEVCEFIRDGDWIESKDQGGSDYRLLQLSNIGVGEYIETGNLRWITRKTFEELNCTEVLQGDVLVARMPDPIGRALYVLELPVPAITAVDIAIIRTSQNALSSQYLSYHLNSAGCLRLLKTLAIGTTRKRIRRSDIEVIRFPLPPLPEQRAIAAVLDGVDEAIARSRGERGALQSLKASASDALLTGRVRVYRDRYKSKMENGL